MHEGPGVVAGSAVRVGVTGHRSLDDVAEVSAAVDRILDGLVATAGGRRVIAVTSLAEGADRVVAERVLARGGGLEVVLPLPAADYTRDFTTVGSRDDFERLVGLADDIAVVGPVGSSREDSYLAAGQAVLERCDVLVALWDGEESRGRGGTGEIVELARASGRRVVIVPTVRATRLGERVAPLAAPVLSACALRRT